MTTLESRSKPPKTIPANTKSKFSTHLSENSSFEETYKKSYSHGLEAIYALENVDVRSIKRIEKISEVQPKQPLLKQKVVRPIQEEFDFGDEYRGWIHPFILKEPIHVLGLSRHVEKILIEHEKKLLGDLISVNLNDFVFVRGFGQGHIEEIQLKLNEYTEGSSLDRSYKIYFISWLKSLVASFDRKRVSVLLEKFDIKDLFSLSPGETIEIRKLTLEKKQEWIEELLIQLKCSTKTIKCEMKTVIDTFIKPWIKRRGGFAKKSELLERFQRMSDNPLISSNVLNLFQDIFFDKKDFLQHFIHEIDEEIFCYDDNQALIYDKIVDKALSYFYKPNVHYSLSELIQFLERDFARNWVGFDEGMIEKVLRLSPHFYLIKEPKGFLSVYRN